jgi:anhydro-N-acetylmuramic acid kinase
MAGQIAASIKQAGGVRILATGGGVYHRFLVDEINKKMVTPLEIPTDEIVQYKEALVFAFLGMLRWQGRPNILASVTGAGSGHSSGAIYLP